MTLKLLSLLSISFIFFGIGVLTSLSVPPVYSQAVSDAWNLIKTGNDLRFTYSTGGANNLYLTDGGNVGIGTNVPLGKFHVQGTTTRYAYITSYGQGVFRTDDNNAINGVILENRTIPSAGNGTGIQYVLGSGTTAIPAGYIGVLGQQAWTTTNTTQDSYMAFHTALDGTVSEKIRISPEGNVGIGTVTPSAGHKLTVQGHMLANGEIAANTFWALVFPAANTSATVCRSTNGQFGSCPGSDRRLKENLQALATSGLETILKLKPVRFDFIRGDKNQAGFIAQEVKEVIPEAITKSSDGYYGLNDSAFTAYLVKAVQELDQENKVLKEQLGSQQLQIDKLREEIGNLKSPVNE